MTQRHLTIVTSDNVTFSVREELVMLIPTLKDTYEMIEGDNTSLPLENINSKKFEKILEYVEKHKDDKPLPKDYLEEFILTDIGLITDWDKEFIAPLSRDELEEFILAVNFLNIRRLLDLCTKTMADIFDKLSDEEFEALCKEIRARAPQLPQEETSDA